MPLTDHSAGDSLLFNCIFILSLSLKNRFHGNDGLGGKVKYSNQRVRKEIRLYLGVGFWVFDKDDMFPCPQMYRYVKITSISQCEKGDLEGVGTYSKDTQRPDPCR